MLREKCPYSDKYVVIVETNCIAYCHNINHVSDTKLKKTFHGLSLSKILRTVPIKSALNHLSGNPTKWSKTIKRFVGCCRRTV